MADYKKVKYWTLIIITLLSIALLPLFLPFGGITPDSLSYFKIAKEIPNGKSNLFPIGYPIVLRIGYFFTNEFYFSSRIISCLSFAVIIGFSYFKKFYFKETALLVTFKFIISLYILSISESIFLTLFYILIFYLNKFLTENKLKFKIIYPAVILTVFLTLVRYTGLYIFIAITIYFICYTIKYKLFDKLIYKNYFYYLLFSSLGIGIYLIYNYLEFGSFFGEHIRLAPSLDSLWKHTLDNLLGVLNVVNPIFSIKILEPTSAVIFIMIGILLIDLFFLLTYIWFYQRPFKGKVTTFHQLLLTIGCIYLILMFISEFTQGIESLNTRMLAPASFCFCFSFLILFFKIYPNKLHYIFMLSILSLAINIIYQLKSPVNYLSYRVKVIKILKERKNLKYFLNDTGNDHVSIYKIPLLNKKFEYFHPYLQSGYINSNIVRSINPDIQTIQKDNSITNKSLILYNSEIK